MSFHVYNWSRHGQWPRLILMERKKWNFQMVETKEGKWPHVGKKNGKNLKTIFYF